MIRKSGSLIVFGLLACLVRCQTPSGDTLLVSAIGLTPGSDKALFIRQSDGHISNVLPSSLEGFIQFATARNKNGPYLLYLQGKPNTASGLYQADQGGDYRAISLPFSGVAAQGDYNPQNASVVLSATPSSSPRGYSLYYVDREISRKLTAPPEGSWDTNPVFRGDGSSVAFVRARLGSGGVLTKLMIVDLGTGQSRELVPEDEGVAAASYAPKGRNLVVWLGKGLEIMSDSGSDVRLLLPTSWLAGRLVDSVTWSTDGTAVFFVVRRTDTQEAQVFQMKVDKSTKPVLISSFSARMVTAIRSLK